jgi:hypothetical protein
VKKTDKPPISGQLLVADFQSAFIGLATAELAKTEAHRSEEAIVSELQSLSTQSYLNPGGISPVRQNDIGRASVNAHVMKVQADQLQQMSYQQLAVLQEELSSKYIGKKVLITPLGVSESPFDTVWLNKETGYRSNQNTKKQIKGTIAEISLDKNLLVVKPTMFPRMINSELNAYFVYVIDSLTAQPAVEVSIL